MQMLAEDVNKAVELGLSASYAADYAIKGWPTKYLNGVLKWLAQQPNFDCYNRTRMVSNEEKGLLSKEVVIGIADGHSITCKNSIEATCVPLQKLSLVTEMEYFRTYCIAIRVPKDSIEDCRISDQADPYYYVRFTACDKKNDYLMIEDDDHKVGQKQIDGRLAELETWVRERFTNAENVDYK